MGEKGTRTLEVIKGIKYDFSSDSHYGLSPNVHRFVMSCMVNHTIMDPFSMITQNMNIVCNDFVSSINPV